MARILYGVMGNTNGHIMRSLALAERLPEHEFHFIGGGRVPEVLAGRHPCLEVPVLRTVHGRSGVSVAGVVGQAVARLAEAPAITRRILDLAEAWQPDLVIADREFFLPLACRRGGIPCLALNHSGLLLTTRYPVPRGQRLSWALAMLNDRMLYDFTRENWSVSFYHPPLRSRRGRVDRLFPPVLRRAVRERRPSDGGHVLVYQTSRHFGPLLPLLEGLKRPVRVYGAGREGTHGPVTFCAFDENRILDDLASCAWVLLNGGHNLLCEAFFLGKPALCTPYPRLFEQYLNAHYVRSLGYGDILDPARVEAGWAERFEARLPDFRAALAAGFRDGTDEVVAALRGRLASGAPRAASG